MKKVFDQVHQLNLQLLTHAEAEQQRRAQDRKSVPIPGTQMPVVGEINDPEDDASVPNTTLH